MYIYVFKIGRPASGQDIVVRKSKSKVNTPQNYPYARSRSCDHQCCLSMDHLPKVSNSNSISPVKVPCYGGVYDDKDWYAFPKRQGWNLISLKDGNAQGCTQSQLHAFLQCWLYLGLLSHLLQETFASISSKYIRVDVEHGPVIDSRYLPEAFARLETSSTVDQKRQIEKAIWHVAEVCGIMTEKNIICQPLLLSIAILIEGLSRPLGNTPPNLYIHHWLQVQLQEIECCPTLFQNLQYRLGISGVYLRIFMGKSSLSHRHFVCTSTACDAFTVSAKTYHMTHARNCSWKQQGDSSEREKAACSLVEVDHKALVEVLSLNTFPILWIDTDGQTPTVRVRPFKEGLKYVAISHVSVILCFEYLL